MPNFFHVQGFGVANGRLQRTCQVIVEERCPNATSWTRVCPSEITLGVSAASMVVRDCTRIAMKRVPVLTAKLGDAEDALPMMVRLICRKSEACGKQSTLDPVNFITKRSAYVPC